MKVKLTDDVQVPTNTRGLNVVHSAPEVIDVPDDVAERFIRIGVAEKVTATQKK